MNDSGTFSIGSTVTVPTTIHPSGKAVIVGREDGAARGRKPVQNVVFLISLGRGPAWEATESELKGWGNV